MRDFIKKNLRKYLEFNINIYNRKLAVELVRKNSIKHCYLCIKDTQKLQIRANRFFTLDDAHELINKKAQWIIKSLNKYEQRLEKKNKEYYLGIELEDGPIEDLDLFYRQKAQEILPSLVEKNANIMGLYPSDLKFRKNKTRFGSCSAKNSISLNILLMRYPLDVIEYVIIHELAHIKHKNHSARFWALVEEYCPNYKKLDAMLKMF